MRMWHAKKDGLQGVPASSADRSIMIPITFSLGISHLDLRHKRIWVISSKMVTVIKSGSANRSSCYRSYFIEVCLVRGSLITAIGPQGLKTSPSYRLSYLNMSSQPSWQPNLPESQLFNEKTWLQGIILSAVAYGVNIALFILIISLLSTGLTVDMKQNGRVSRKTTYLLAYVCVMFILSTLTIGSQAELTQLSFIENRNFPGGPAAYADLPIPMNDLGEYCNCMMNWLSDGLLLWRCLVVYGSSRTSVWLVMAIPGLMMLASFVIGTILLERVSRVSPSPYIFELIYAIMSLSLNVVLTLMIVIRLYLHRRRITKLLGRHHAAQYTSIISMLIESAAITVVMLLWFLIPYVLGNQLANIPVISLFQVQAAASYMIIFRVAKGTAWTSQTVDSLFTIPDLFEHPEGGLSNIRFQTGSFEHPADSPITPRFRNQFPQDEPRDVLDTESNIRVTVYEGSPRDPTGITVEMDRPNAK